MTMTLGRRAIIAAAGLAASGLPCAPSHATRPQSAIAGEWGKFKGRFLRDDGRLVDTGNGGVSHSESQSYGLLLSASVDDPEGFRRILTWTRANLAIRPQDTLMAWRYRHGAVRPVDDLNNATDGDLMFAWACARAYDRWKKPEHLALARAIAQDILKVLSVTANGKRYLLPGSTGFFHGDRIVLNPSYHVVPALRRMSELVPDRAWAEILAAGDEVVQRSRRGTWNLPPDWAQVGRAGGNPAPSTSNPQRFGYDAVRVPLNLVWGGDQGSEALRSIDGFWSGNPTRMPGWVDLRTGGFSPEPASDGHRAIAKLTSAALAGWQQTVSVGGVEKAYDYYSAALIMLVRLALSDLGKPQPSL